MQEVLEWSNISSLRCSTEGEDGKTGSDQDNSTTWERGTALALLALAFALFTYLCDGLS